MKFVTQFVAELVRKRIPVSIIPVRIFQGRITTYIELGGNVHTLDVRRACVCVTMLRAHIIRNRRAHIFQNNRRARVCVVLLRARVCVVLLGARVCMVPLGAHVCVGLLGARVVLNRRGHTCMMAIP